MLESLKIISSPMLESCIFPVTVGTEEETSRPRDRTDFYIILSRSEFVW